MRLMLTLLLLFALAMPALAVDGVLEINQACAVQTGCFAGDTAGFPVTITASGSYRLTGNLAAGGQLGIGITAGDVTLDLNGFVVSTSMTAITSNSANTRLFNGTARTTSQDSEVVNLGDSATIDRLTMVGDVDVDDEAQITNCTITTEVRMGSNGRFIGNTITGSDDGVGLSVGAKSIVKDNFIGSFLGGSLIVTGGSCVVSGNTFTGTNFGMMADNCVVVNNSINGGVSQGGIVAHGSTIIGNFVTNAFHGIVANNSTVIGNTANGNFGRGLSANASTGYKDNQFNNNNGGNANPQVSGGIEIGTNICGGDTTCP